jgi:hypothetical protein
MEEREHFLSSRKGDPVGRERERERDSYGGGLLALQQKRKRERQTLRIQMVCG